MAYLDLEGILEEVIGAILYGGGIQDVIAEIVARMGWLLSFWQFPRYFITQQSVFLEVVFTGFSWSSSRH